MRFPTHPASPGAGAVLAAILGLAPCAPAANGDSVAACTTGRAALHAMLDSEYAFGEKAQTSLSGAFLEYLAEDSWVLHPGPEPGRAVYQAAKDTKNKLEWYPAVGDIAPSGDLGFTTGPWVYTLADGGMQRHGHFLTVWKRDAKCRWQVEFDGGVSHRAPRSVEPKLHPERAPFKGTELPPLILVTNDAAGQAVSDFQDTAQRDGFAAALRTYGRNNDFLFYTDEQSPISGVGSASAYLMVHALTGAWREVARDRSADSTLLYSVGLLTDGNKHRAHAYVQIWQYDPKVANWGLRVLLLNPLPPPKEK